jgi:hypothetical protein
VNSVDAELRFRAGVSSRFTLAGLASIPFVVRFVLEQRGAPETALSAGSSAILYSRK